MLGLSFYEIFEGQYWLSSVATCFMCGGIFSDNVIANFLPSVPFEEFGKSVKCLAKIWTKVWSIVLLPHDAMQNAVLLWQVGCPIHL